MGARTPAEIVASVLLVLVPVAFGAAALLLGLDLPWSVVALGAAGWFVALLGRAPVAVVARRRAQDDPRRLQRTVAAASGFLEEPVRLAALLLVGASVPAAYALGVGWGLIEAVYAVVNGAARTALAERTDAEAVQAKQMLEQLGMGETITGANPAWGVVERIAATQLHLAFGLFYVVSPWLVIVTVPLHSAVNLTLMEWLMRRRSLPAVELALLASASVLFAGALVAVG